MAENLDPKNVLEAVSGQHSEFVASGNGTAIKDHPLAKIAGSYADDPFWDEFVQAMETPAVRLTRQTR